MPSSFVVDLNPISGCGCVHLGLLERPGVHSRASGKGRCGSYIVRLMSLWVEKSRGVRGEVALKRVMQGSWQMGEEFMRNRCGGMEIGETGSG